MTSERAAPEGDPARPGVPAPSPELLDLYKMAVEMSDRVSARRGAVNAFFLSVQTAFVGVLGITATDGQKVPWWAALVLALAGISISFGWWLQLRSYRVLSRAKFDIINAVEPQLPLQVFRGEWEIPTRNSDGPRWTRYTELVGCDRTGSPLGICGIARRSVHRHTLHVSYLRADAGLIRELLPPQARPPADADSLFLLYAVLMRAKGEQVAAADVHDAWAAWTETRNPDHAALVPFGELSPATQRKDEPYVQAIQAAARVRTKGRP